MLAVLLYKVRGETLNHESIKDVSSGLMSYINNFHSLEGKGSMIVWWNSCKTRINRIKSVGETQRKWVKKKLIRQKERNEKGKDH